jgi:murein L,D-transpeptidase YafK
MKINMRYCFILLLFLLPLITNAQPPLDPQYPDNQFQNFQLSMQRVKAAHNNSDYLLRKAFNDKGIKYPSKHIYIRSFKGSNEFELYARNKITDTFTLVKYYKVCALSGILGPKRWEGDRQVPEGFYFIEDFNPRSNYHLSLLLNYPNYSDRFFSNADKPGGGIYIHGGCMTVGCLPMTNKYIEEIYTICVQARTAGQMYIPVHIFPVRFNKKSLNFLGREYKNEDVKHKFWINLKRAYDYFEATKKVPPTMYDQDGNYTF